MTTIILSKAANPAWVYSARLGRPAPVPAFYLTVPLAHPVSDMDGAVVKDVPAGEGVFHYRLGPGGGVEFSYTPGPGEMKTGSGGDWSSNPATLRRLTGLDAVEVHRAYYPEDDGRKPGHMVGYALKSVVEQLLPPGFEYRTSTVCGLESAALVQIKAATVTCRCWSHGHETKLQLQPGREVPPCVQCAAWSFIVA